MKQLLKTLWRISRHCPKNLKGPAFSVGLFLTLCSSGQAACTVPQTQSARIAQIEMRAVQTHSAAQMDCAAMIALVSAQKAPENSELQVMALGVVAQTIDLLGSLKRGDLMGVDNAMITRIHQLAAKAITLAETNINKTPDNADIRLLHAVILVLTAPWLDAEKSVDATRRAMGMLEHVIKTAPGTQGGMAQSVLGRIYFELPPLLGGDVIRSIALLEEARRRGPENIQTLRYLAESYDQELEEEKAVGALRKMIRLKAQPGQYQLMADELGLGGGLALRLKARDVAAKIGAKRMELFKAHPELLTRASTAVGGHGGANPLEGK